ncbi:hypothetical protein D9M72_619260 [compost metagenome]
MFAKEQGRKSDGEENLQQLDLTDAGNAPQRQAGIPGKKANELGEQRDVAERPPCTRGNWALMLQRQIHDWTDQQGRGQHQCPADDLPTAHFPRQPTSLGITQAAHGNGCQHQ